MYKKLYPNIKIKTFTAVFENAQTKALVWEHKNVKKIDVDLSKGKVLIAYNNNQEIKFDDIKEKILINGQNAIDMTIINL